MQNSDLGNSILQVIAPLIGESMAHASLKAHCTKNGIDISNIRPQDLPTLATGLGLGLACFIGRERAQNISRTILDLNR